jgi:hypothetical protein
LEAANCPLNGDLHNLLRRRFITQLSVSGMMRSSPNVPNGSVHGLLNPFLLRRELRVPA